MLGFAMVFRCKFSVFSGGEMVFVCLGVVKLARWARRSTLDMDDYSVACTYVRADLCMESLSEAWIYIS